MKKQWLEESSYIYLGNFIYLKCDLVADGYVLTIKDSEKKTLTGSSIIAADSFEEVEKIILRKFGLKVISSFKEIAGCVKSGFVGLEASCRRVLPSPLNRQFEKDYVSSWNVA